MSQVNFVDYPRIHQRTDGKFEIIFRYQDRRFRLQNGKKFGIPLRPNSYPEHERANQAKRLAAEIYTKLLYGEKLLVHSVSRDIEKKNQPDIYYLKKALDQKLEEGHSKHHRNALILAFKRIKQASDKHTIDSSSLEKVLSIYKNNTSFNTVRRNMNVLFIAAAKFGLNHNPIEAIKRKKEKAKLNKAIDHPEELLQEIKAFNYNLFLCCLLTYGCLLRPHREVRELKWKDFNRDLTFISLSGERNKSGRNRIVPIPTYVKKILVRGDDERNIFSGTKEPYDPDYFKCLWSRFKKKSMILTENQTLYSFRHTGAISVYKKTGSLEKLKAAMGHSNILVSMTYLRGLDIPELEEEDMPSLAT